MGWAALGIFAMDAIYVVAFRNASFIHAYASFYFVAPIAMMSGVFLDALIQWVENRSGNRPVPRAAVWWGVWALIAFLGVSGFTTSRMLDREQHCILDWKTHEPPDLVPRLAKVIRETFTEDTLVLCNFLPAYGPHLHYYAQRNLWNNMNAYAEWGPVIHDPQLHSAQTVFSPSHPRPGQARTRPRVATAPQRPESDRQRAACSASAASAERGRCHDACGRSGRCLLSSSSRAAVRAADSRSGRPRHCCSADR